MRRAFQVDLEAAKQAQEVNLVIKAEMEMQGFQGLWDPKEMMEFLVLTDLGVKKDCQEYQVFQENQVVQELQELKV